MTPLDLLLWALAVLAVVVTVTLSTVIIWATISAMRGKGKRNQTLFDSNSDR
ncbi:hypothetical protein [Gulosibacter massiliensis]|uniref:hypothetical protein n=1 Tax=Gulosibacter massiliensis TaxID=2479839 RepID=UPI0013DDF0B3|nr:hypothetical protein [Gulosibacter massiliensis]